MVSVSWHGQKTRGLLTSRASCACRGGRLGAAPKVRFPRRRGVRGGGKRNRKEKPSPDYSLPPSPTSAGTSDTGSPRRDRTKSTASAPSSDREPSQIRDQCSRV